MNFKELKNQSEKELTKLLADSREKLREMRFKVASNQLKNVNEIKKIRITIAQTLFLINQKKKETKEVK
ncbi:MAG: 50S ribosomal protein L29 [Candidatus Buchananbacteria bacterium]